MDYVINFSDANKTAFVIKPHTFDGPTTPPSISSHTSIVLAGKGRADYGEFLQEGLVHMLENFANDFPPPFPIQGQLWYKNATVPELFIYDGENWCLIPLTCTAAISISHPAHPDFFNSILRKKLINAPSWAEPKLSECMDVLDKEIYQLVSRNRRKLIENVDYPIAGIVTGMPGKFSLLGDVTPAFKVGFKFDVTSNIGTADGIYTVSNSSFDGTNTIITTNELVPVGSTVTGGIGIMTFETPWYIVEQGSLLVTINGVKHYAHERAFTKIIPNLNPKVLNIGNWAGLFNGSYTFDIGFDGNSPATVGVVVSQTNFSIISLNFLNNTLIVSGAHAAEFDKNIEILVVDNTGLGMNTALTVLSATESMNQTFVTVKETIAGASIDGKINIAYTVNDLINTINIGISLISSSAIIKGGIVQLANNGICVLEEGEFVFFSNKSGVGSEVVVVDVDLFSTIETNLQTVVPIIFFQSPPITRILGYAEFGTPQTGISNIIELSAPLFTNAIMEIQTLK